jgi:DNA-binding transcriptional ArsR family regulator
VQIILSVDATSSAAAPLEAVVNSRRASALLHPLRSRLLALAREPASSTELARRIGLPRQRVNYHVRALERAGLLRAAGRRRRRNLIEQRYVATARSYVLSPSLLGPLAADWRAISDTASAEYLLALAEQVRLDVTRATEEAAGEGKRLATLSLKSQFRFETPEQRTRFAEAVRQALVEVIARHSSPNLRENGRSGRGRPYRLVLACYPVSAGVEAEETRKGG